MTTALFRKTYIVYPQATNSPELFSIFNQLKQIY